MATGRLLTWYSLALVLSATSLAAALIVRGYTAGGSIWVLPMLAAFALYAERRPVRFTANTELTVSVLPILFAAVILGPLAAMIVAAAALTTTFGRPYQRWATWTAMRCLAGGLAGLASGAFGSVDLDIGPLIAAVTTAAITEAVVDVGLNATTAAIRRTAGDYLRSMRPVLLVTVPLYAPVLVLSAYAFESVSGWSILLFFGPGFAAQSLYRLYREEREARTKLLEANVRLQRANLSFASALVAALDARDQYTAGHSAAVAIYARDIAAHMDLTEYDQQLAHLCGLLHDVGKVGLPPGILEKPGALDDDERYLMEQHSAIGERILANVEDYAEIALVVRHHHERVDGEGYPDRIQGAEIPLLSRIIGVADAYNAMNSDRPYRRAMGCDVALARLTDAAGSQFDARVIAAFDAILAEASFAYASGVRADFAVEAQRHPVLMSDLGVAAA